MAYNINITETVPTKIVTENGLNSEQQTFCTSPTC